LIQQLESPDRQIWRESQPTPTIVQLFTLEKKNLNFCNPALTHFQRFPQRYDVTTLSYKKLAQKHCQCRCDASPYFKTTDIAEGDALCVSTMLRYKIYLPKEHFRPTEKFQLQKFLPKNLRHKMAWKYLFYEFPLFYFFMVSST